MNARLTITIGVLLSLTAVHDAGAQWNNARLQGGRNRIYMTIGLDPAIITTVGYARVIPVWGHEFQLGTDVGIVAAKPDLRDFRARVELQSTVLRYRSVQLAGSCAFITRGTENAIYRGLNFGADCTGSAGMYRSGWFAAAQFGKDKAIVTHITHTDWYREHAYEDAKDGWYLDAGGTFHYGMMAGLTVGRTELVARAGLRKTEDFNVATPPFYGSFGVGVPF